jgi:hypothetical protein
MKNKINELIMKLCKKGYSKTGVSKCNKANKLTKRAALESSFIWPNQIMVVKEEVRDGYDNQYLQIKDRLSHVKKLVKSNIKEIKFRVEYCPERWDQYTALKVFVKSDEFAIVDNAKALSSLVLERETKDILPFIEDGSIEGKIKINNGVVEYTLFRNIYLTAKDLIEVSYLAYEDSEISIVQNVKNVGINDTDTDNLDSIKFEYYNEDTIDKDRASNVKKEVMQMVKNQLEYKKDMYFKGYEVHDIWHIGHSLGTHHSNPYLKYFRVAAGVTFIRKIEDTRYGVLFKLA